MRFLRELPRCIVFEATFLPGIPHRPTNCTAKLQDKSRVTTVEPTADVVTQHQSLLDSVWDLLQKGSQAKRWCRRWPQEVPRGDGLPGQGSSNSSLAYWDLFDDAISFTRTYFWKDLTAWKCNDCWKIYFFTFLKPFWRKKTPSPSHLNDAASSAEFIKI